MTVSDLIHALQQIDSTLPVVMIHGPDFDLVTNVEVTFGVDVARQDNPSWWYSEATNQTANATPLLWVQ